MEGYRFSTEISVRFAETDAQGIAHHASFVVWLEVARVAYLAEHAGGYGAIRKQGVEALTTEVNVRYHRAAYFDDRLTVWTRCVDLRGARFRYEYAVERGRRARRRRVHGACHRRRRDAAAAATARSPSSTPSLGLSRSRRLRLAGRGRRADGSAPPAAPASPCPSWEAALASASASCRRGLLAVLAPVGGVPGLVVQHRAVRVVDGAVDARGARLRPFGVDDRRAFLERPVGMRRTGTDPVMRTVPGLLSTRRSGPPP